MKLLSLNKKTLSFFLILFITPLFSEEAVDIWKKENLNENLLIKETLNTTEKKLDTNVRINIKAPKKIEIDSSDTEISKPIYGIFEPEENDLTLDMWLNSEGTRVKDTIDRINKIKLSSFAEELFVNTMFTISNLPQQNITDEEFLNYKLNWLIENQKDDLITIFLNKNKNFPNKKKIIKYLVDKNIAAANVREACKKVSSITINVKDTYLDQFKIICLINNNKKNEAQLMHDLLREQKLSNKFFDNKISFLLDLKKEEDKTIDDSSLLNFYLSSITVSDFNYMPNKKTDKKIWKYLISSNLLKVDDFESKNEIKKLEIIANNNNLAKSYIFEIYTNLKFNFNDFLNIDEAYLTLDSVSARALIYQKILLSDNVEAKLKYLFLLNDLFKKDNLTNIFKEYLSQELQALDFEKIPLGYKNLVFQNITEKKEKILGKIKYNDSKYYTSKITKFYTEKNNSKNKIQKELEKIHNKIKRNKKYKIFIQDAILFESLENDGFKIPKGINFNEIKKNNLPPIELLNLVKNKEVGLVLLRIIELVGEDEILDLDLQTIYFINYLFNEAGFTRTRNKILFTILPERSEI
tara:strand:- start:2262 stop:4004 length:1743 start_codon:yes stop_codon:yes gene_type:complete